MSASAPHAPQPPANKEHQVLQEHHDDLLAQVATTKLVHFSAELYRSQVISRQVHDVFASLDDALEPKLTIRYLLQGVSEGVKHDVSVFRRFLKVLAGYEGPAKQLASRLREESLEGWALADGAGSGREVGGNLYLVEADLHKLMEVLAEVSDSWELLGTALQLPQHIIDDCRRSTNRQSMTRILREWILCNKSDNCTLKSLHNALVSKQVGRVRAAEDLEMSFRECLKPCETTLVPKPPRSESPLRVAYLSSDTEVADGKSALLEVQVSDNEGVWYQWVKEGQPLTDGLAYSGAHTPILAIRPARQGAQGKYTCHITRGSEEVISQSVPLTVSFLPEKEHLLKLYSKTREVPRDSWPPRVTNTFIDLALITKSTEVTDVYEFSVHGDIDDVLETKEKIDFEAVFGEYESGALVLVEGRPGSGKTTLLHKVSRDWATRGDVLKGAKLTLHVPLRHLANRTTENLSDLLGLLYQDRGECEKVVTDITQSKGKGVCFILDGLDEFHPQEETKSIIYLLLYEECLPMAMIIVASRPVATEKLRCAPHVNIRVEVLGFSPEQILEYVDKYPFTSHPPNSSSPAQLKAHLNSHPNLLHMCYLPVHAAMICFLHEHEHGIPANEADIYEHFTKFIVLRNLKRANAAATLPSLKDLRRRDKKHFRKICRLAFNMTTNSSQTVCQSDTDVPLSLCTGPDDTPTLGLLTVDRTAKLDQLDNTYTFLHLTFQEYLAALHLAQLKNREQKKIVNQYAAAKHMRVVWKFYCSIGKTEDKLAEIQHIMWPADSKRLQDILHEVHCAFVSQTRLLCDNLVEGRAGKLVFDGSTLTPPDMTAMGYVITTASHPVTCLTMNSCFLHAAHVTALLREVSLNKLNSIQILDFNDNKIGAEGAVALAGALKTCNNLKQLGLNNNKIDEEGAVALAGALKTCNNLKKLRLNNNNIGDDGAVALAGALKTCNNLQLLRLSNNNIGDCGAVAMAGALKTCNNLEFLMIHNNKIGANGFSALKQLKFTYIRL